MNTQTLTRSLVLCGFLAASLFGQSPAKPPRTPIFISPTLVDSVVLLTPPPPIDSPRMSREVGEIYAIHRSATPQEIERANWDNKHENLFAIAIALSDKLNAESMPNLTKLWTDMDNDQGIFVSAAKKYWQELRLYDLDANIKSICGSKPGGPKNSYPSGHGTTGYLSALVLSMMVPKSEVLHARATNTGTAAWSAAIIIQ